MLKVISSENFIFQIYPNKKANVAAVMRLTGTTAKAQNPLLKSL